MHLNISNLNISKLVNTFIPIYLYYCNKENKYSECSYNDFYYYNGCIISLNYNDPYIRNCIYITGNNIFYNLNSNSGFDFNIHKYTCNKDNNYEMYKNKIDSCLKLTECFINYKNKKTYDKNKDCNTINNNIDFEKRYLCLIE